MKTLEEIRDTVMLVEQHTARDETRRKEMLEPFAYQYQSGDSLAPKPYSFRYIKDQSGRVQLGWCVPDSKPPWMHLDGESVDPKQLPHEDAAALENRLRELFEPLFRLRDTVAQEKKKTERDEKRDRNTSRRRQVKSVRDFLKE